MRNKLISILAGAAFSFAADGFGFAADMAVKQPPPPAPVPVFSWTGFYVGGNAGYGWGRANDEMTLGGFWPLDGTGDNLFVGPLGNNHLRPNGFTGGAEAGYNYQAGPWVWGVEADWEYFGLKDNFAATVTAAGMSRVLLNF